MKDTQKTNFFNEPYRLMFPLGTLFLLWGIFLWLPQLWSQESYPVLSHRTLVLNGFMAMFVGGFLMTAVPKFSRSQAASPIEALLYIANTIAVILMSFWTTEETLLLILSSIQAFQIFFFAFRRFRTTKASPPFTFVFIFLGIVLWILSGFVSDLLPLIPRLSLQYDGAILAIILGIGSKLIPGILGHEDVISIPNSQLEQKGFLRSVPLYFYLLMALYALSFCIDLQIGTALRCLIVFFISMKFWKLYLLPPTKTSLAYCIWISAWLIVFSGFLKAFWIEGYVHAGHSFFINGIVLLSILIATRVLQAHGPKRKELENSKWLYFITFLVALAAATRVSAILMPDNYYRHLAYSSIVLGLALFIWIFKYLKFVFVFPKEISFNG